MDRVALFPIVLLANLVLGCGEGDAPAPGAGGQGGTGGAGGAGGAILKPPTQHRPEPVACTAPRPPGDAPALDGSCTSDADCTAGENGRCTGLATTENACTYDECTVDADCGAARVCDCRNPSKFHANVCFHGNCVVDADCGAGGYCSPSATELSPYCELPPGSIGYFCRTTADECVEDNDCQGDDLCVFVPEGARWTCVTPACWF